MLIASHFRGIVFIVFFGEQSKSFASPLIKYAEAYTCIPKIIRSASLTTSEKSATKIKSFYRVQTKKF